MASTKSILFLLSTLVILLLATPSLGTILDLPQGDLSRITQFKILGLVTCPITSSLPLVGLLGAAEVPVTVTCDGISISQASVVTELSGLFSLPITGLNGAPLSLVPNQQISCSVAVEFPVSETSCQTFPTTGRLVAPAQFGSTENVLGGLGDLIAVLYIQPFQYIAA